MPDCTVLSDWPNFPISGHWWTDHISRSAGGGLICPLQCIRVERAVKPGSAATNPGLRLDPAIGTLRRLFTGPLFRIGPLPSGQSCRPGNSVRQVFTHARIHRAQIKLTMCGIVLAIVALLLTSGCSNIQSQAANVEGVRLYQQGNYQQASDLFQQAIAENPKSPEGYYNLAASLHKTGLLYNRPADLQQAENLYNQCLERDPGHTECYRGLAVLLTETNRQTEAFNLLNHWSEGSPKSPDPKIELARLLEEVGQGEQAKAQLVDALTIDPHNARALTALGRLRDQSGDHVQALANYQRSLSINRFQPEVAARVAQLQGAVGAPIMATPSTEPRTASGMQPAMRY